MSIEIDILIRKFDYFNIDGKVETIRHKATKYLQQTKNNIENDIKNFELEQSNIFKEQNKILFPKNKEEVKKNQDYKNSLNQIEQRMKEKKKLLDEQNKKIEEKNKELDELKKKYPSSGFRPNYFTNLFKFTYKSIDFNKDTINQIKDFIFEETNKINMPICRCCYSFWSKEKFFDAGVCESFIKKIQIDDFQLMKDQVSNNELVI